MSTRIKFELVFLFSLIFVAPLSGFAQAAGASLTGQVTDPSGAGIPAATVAVENVATTLNVQAMTDAQGFYRVSPLPPGSYSLTVTSNGFSTYIQQGIILTVGRSATQNVFLKLASTQQTVQVTANAELINTTSPSIGMTVSETEVSELPLNGRDPQSLVFLAPGMTNGTAYGIAKNQGDFTFPSETGGSSGVGAGRAGSTYYLLDGASNLDDYVGLAAPFPNADASREFRVITNNSSAQYGFSPGAVVLIETRSGTNSFHGGAWEFLRNQSFNGSNWFSHTVDPLHRNQFGADIGGPALKNKLFFFTNYQGTRTSSTSTSGLEYTYTAAMLNGDFSGVPVTLKAPFHTVNGKTNQIDPALFNQTAIQIVQLIMPQSTNPNGQLFYSTAKQFTDFNEGTARVDYTISPSQRAFARAFVNYFNRPAGGIPGNISTAVTLNPEEDYNLAVGHTWIINPKLVNVVTLSNTQMDFKSVGLALMSNNKLFCWSQFIKVSEPEGCYTEGLSITGSGSSFSGKYGEPCANNHGNTGLFDNFSAAEGKHNLSFGINAIRRWMVNNCDYPSEPIIAFNGQYTNYAMGDFLLGDMASMYQGAGASGTYTDWQLGLYAEDQFRLRPGLTFELGLRWDPNFPLKAANGRAATFVAGQQSTVYPNAPAGLVFPGDKGIGPGLMPTTYGYWEPRVGFAWQPHALPRTSFHAGFGMFTAPQIIATDDHTTENSPFSPSFSLNGTPTTPLSFNNPWAGFSGTGGVSPFPPFASTGYRPPSSATFTPGLSMVDGIDPNSRLGVTQAWNLAVEYQLGPNTMVRVAYVGSESYHQPNSRDKNPGIFAKGGARSTYSNFGQILMNESAGTASYNGMQATVERHLSHGLQFQSNFTWSKLIDTESDADIALGTQLPFDPFDLHRNRGISLANFPNIWVSSVIYTSPMLSKQSQIVRQILGGWEMSAIITSQSGQPFTVYGGFGNNNSQSLQFQDHANRVQGQPLNVRQGGRSHWLNNYFNINAFTQNPPGTFGDSGKAIIAGPPYNNTDAGLDKNWRILEKYTVQFRWEMFNAFNHPNFKNPNATNQIGPSGNNTGGIEGKITSIFGAPRIMQGALKFTF